jgi:hypothetical protein
MGALISGFVGFFVIVLGLTFLIQYPAIFWVLLLLIVFALIFGFRKGRKQSVLSNPDREARRRAALNQRLMTETITRQYLAQSQQVQPLLTFLDQMRNQLLQLLNQILKLRMPQLCITRVMILTTKKRASISQACRATR